jgi:hypothetical protein
VTLAQFVSCNGRTSSRSQFGSGRQSSSVNATQRVPASCSATLRARLSPLPGTRVYVTPACSTTCRVGSGSALLSTIMISYCG